MDTMQVAGMRRLLLVGVPITYAVLMVFHPLGEGGVFEALHDHAQRWLIVHVVQLFCIGLLAVAMYRLIEGVPGRGATISRLALMPFVLFYAAYEAIAGIGTGILIDHARDLPPDEQAVASAMIQAYWESPIAGNISAFSAIGTLSWLVVAGGAVLAFHRIGAPRVALVLLGLGGLLFGISHAPPIGPAGLVMISLAMVWLSSRPVPVSDLTDRAGMAFTGVAEATRRS